MKTFLPFLLLLPSLAAAAQFYGAKIPDTVSVSGKTLQLNGAGLREATIFNVKVYVGALYLEKKSSNPEQILTSDTPKAIEMRFLRDVSADKLRDAWKEGIEKNCKTDCASLDVPLKQLNSMMREMKEGDLLAVYFFPERVEVSVKGGKSEPIEGANFSRTLLKIWLGEDPPNEHLKSGMLGLKK